MKNRQELIKAYIDFFKSKNHKELPNSSLIPENDPTVLFTTAGMHPLVPYLSGQKHPLGKRLVNVQKCIRTGDINEVGDEVHHTFFEMLGNWSLGDYFKKEAIQYSFEFLTKILKLPIEKLAISVFAGDKNAKKDTEAIEIWQSLGIPIERIISISNDNWWGPAGKTGPCGPDTEMFYWKLNDTPPPKRFDPNDNNWVEIWNDVLMQYNKDDKAKYNPAKQKNIDTGMGVERTIAILNGLEDNYLASYFQPMIKQIEKISNKKYGKDKETTKAMRIIADHIKASAFIINDGISPGNVEQGYVLRRLIRRALRHLRKLGVDLLKIDSTIEIAKPIMKIYSDYNLDEKRIFKELKQEEDRFQKTLDKGLREFNKMSDDKLIDGKESFLLYQSYGFPIEMIQELAKEKNIKIDLKGFEKELNKHQKLSRTATQGKFKSGLADSGEQTTKLHTATHLLNQALRQVLKKPDIMQKGSNITPERLRFDFNFDRKLTEQEVKQVEDLINKITKQSLPVKREEMSTQQAKKIAQGVFESKYGEKVSVYSIGNFSKEICAGPHISNTSELGTFKIKKQESSSAGVRRIKAVLI